VYESVGDFSEAHRMLESMAGDEGEPRGATRPEVEWIDLVSDGDDISGEFSGSPRRSSPRRRASSPEASSPEASSPHPGPRFHSGDRNRSPDDDRDGTAASGKCLNLKRRRTLSRGVAPKPTKRSKAGFFVKLRRVFSKMRRMWNNLDEDDEG
jgi:hypothetical protein